MMQTTNKFPSSKNTLGRVQSKPNKPIEPKVKTIRIIQFEGNSTVPEQLAGWKNWVLKLLKLEANRKVFTRGYIIIDDRKQKLWPGFVMRTEKLGIDIVILGLESGNKYLYASVTAIEYPGELYRETSAIYTMTTTIPQPKSK